MKRISTIVLQIAIVLSFSSLIIATAAGVCERILKSAVELKTENDLTV